MGDVRVVINQSGVRDLLNSAGVQNMLLEHARKVADRAGDGFEADVRPGKNRAHARVNATTWKAVGSNRKHNTLLKALGGV